MVHKTENVTELKHSLSRVTLIFNVFFPYLYACIVLFPCLALLSFCFCQGQVGSFRLVLV